MPKKSIIKHVNFDSIKLRGTLIMNMMKRKRILAFFMVFFTILLILFYINSKYTCKNFFESALDKNLFPKINPKILDKYINLNNSIGYVNQRLMQHQAGNQDYNLGNMLCSLFQLGYNNFDKRDLEALKRKLKENPENRDYQSVIVVSLIENKISNKLLYKTLRNLEYDVVESYKKKDRFKTKVYLWRYLCFSEFFDIPFNEDLKNTLIDFLYPEKGLVIDNQLSNELILDLKIAKVLNIGFNQSKFINMLNNSWANSSYFQIKDCSSLCEVKSINEIVFLDLFYNGIVPEEYLINMTSYILTCVNDNGSITLENAPVEETLLRSRCDEFCQVQYWQIILDLNYLLIRLGSNEEITRMISYSD